MTFAPGSTCPFCTRIQSGDIVASNDHAAAFADGFPISPGHILVVPRRHEADYFALSELEQGAIWRLVSELRAQHHSQPEAAGFNVGINVGAAAGQTVWHAHVHLIPRYAGDVEDPRGGVRWIIPSKAAYWRKGEPGSR
jgi:diadenosine tetraphosphate (Ap4A) HIT family hydrolase